MINQEYKCPNCNGVLAFDSNSQKLKCSACDSIFELSEAKSFNDSLNFNESFSWRKVASSYEKEEGDNYFIYTCVSCGSEIVQDKQELSSSCPFCGNNIVRKSELMGIKPELIIPFKLNKEEAKEKYLSFVKKDFAPKAFTDSNHIDEIKGIYVPFWLSEAKMQANIRYYGYQDGEKWQDDEKRYQEKKKYLLIRSGDIYFSAVPSCASDKVDSTLMEAIEPFDIKEAVNFNSDYLAGYLASNYSVGIDEAEERIQERIKESTINAFKESVDEYEDVETDGIKLHLEKGEVRYILLPVWLLLTKYDGNNYLFAMNGQSGKMAGDIPVDKKAYYFYLFKRFLLYLIIAYLIYLAFSYIVGVKS